MHISFLTLSCLQGRGPRNLSCSEKGGEDILCQDIHPLAPTQQLAKDGCSSSQFNRTQKFSPAIYTPSLVWLRSNQDLIAREATDLRSRIKIKPNKNLNHLGWRCSPGLRFFFFINFNFQGFCFLNQRALSECNGSL